jgi:hypothetical protein
MKRKTLETVRIVVARVIPPRTRPWLAAAVLGMVLLCWLLWLFRWQYFPVGEGLGLVRVNRYTGETEWIDARHWWRRLPR